MTGSFGEQPIRNTSLEKIFCTICIEITPKPAGLQLSESHQMTEEQASQSWRQAAKLSKQRGRLKNNSIQMHRMIVNGTKVT